MPMKLEAWPGGRWYRDLGDNNGHLWGHVQAIKRPTLLEISGPLMMSFAASSNVQYRLKDVDGGTLITLRHTARSREGFARGALRAAQWVAGKKGFFEFREILKALP